LLSSVDTFGASLGATVTPTQTSRDSLTGRLGPGQPGVRTSLPSDSGMEGVTLDTGGAQRGVDLFGRQADAAGIAAQRLANSLNAAASRMGGMSAAPAAAGGQTGHRRTSLAGALGDGHNGL